MAVEFVSSAQIEVSEIEKKLVKIMCELKCFQAVTVRWERTFFAIISNGHFYIFSPFGDVNVSSCDSSVVVFSSYLLCQFFCWLMSEADRWRTKYVSSHHGPPAVT